MALTAFLVLDVIYSFCFTAYVQNGISMSPTINKGDYFLVSNVAYLVSSPSRGDVVTFRQGNGFRVARIVGMSGDHIQMREGRLYVNGRAGDLKYDGEFSAGCQGYDCPTHVYMESAPGLAAHRVIAPVAYGPMGNTDESVVPPGAYFVLYDNRETPGNSPFSDIPQTGGDSRFSGFVLKPSINGRVISVVFDDRTQVWEWTSV